LGISQFMRINDLMSEIADHYIIQRNVSSQGINDHIVNKKSQLMP
jgi:hypothetical protein